MNTLTKGFARRVISMLLATIMVFSLGIVGLTTASAANVELSETGWGYVNCVFYFDNSVRGMFSRIINAFGNDGFTLSRSRSASS